MSWEVAAVLCVLIICATVVFTMWAIFIKVEPPQVSIDEFEMLKVSIGVLKTDHENISKLAEETKKLLSQQNLANGFRGQR